MVTNIVAIGDSQFEIDAASVLASRFERACIKTIKLKSMPSIIELTKQIELINTSFVEICNSGNNLTIRLQKTDTAPGQEVDRSPKVDAEVLKKI